MGLPAGVSYGSLTPCQQQAYGNGDPNFMTAVCPGYMGVSGGTVPLSVIQAQLAQPMYQPNVGMSITDPAVQAAVTNPTYITYQGVGAQPTTTFSLQTYLLQKVAELRGYTLVELAASGITDPSSAAAWVVSEAQSFCGMSGGAGCDATSYASAVAAAQQAMSQINFTPLATPAPGTNAYVLAPILQPSVPPATNAAATVAPAAPGKVNTTVPTAAPTSTSPGGPGTVGGTSVVVTDPAANTPGTTSPVTQGTYLPVVRRGTGTTSAPVAVAGTNQWVWILAIAAIAFIAFK